MSTVSTRSTGSTAMVRRLPVHDEYSEDGRTVVFVNGLLFAFTELASATLARLAESEATVEELREMLVETFGEPEEGSTLNITADLVEQLRHAGVVEIDELDDTDS